MKGSCCLLCFAVGRKFENQLTANLLASRKRAENNAVPLGVALCQRLPSHQLSASYPICIFPKLPTTTAIATPTPTPTTTGRGRGTTTHTHTHPLVAIDPFTY